MAGLILIAENDAKVADELDASLRRDGFRTVVASDGEAAADFHASLRPDLVLLDVRMPKRDGWDLLGELRRRGNTPVIMLAAAGREGDRLQALRIGADDYVVKPVDPVEMVARVQAILRRSGGVGEGRLLRVGPLEIDLETYLATAISGAGQRRLALTLTEFRILAHMARVPLKVFTRAELAEACLGGDDVQDRTVDSHLSKLRKKLEDVGAARVLASVRGVGYRLDPGA